MGGGTLNLLLADCWLLSGLAVSVGYFLSLNTSDMTASHSRFTCSTVVGDYQWFVGTVSSSQWCALLYDGCHKSFWPHWVILTIDSIYWVLSICEALKSKWRWRLWHGVLALHYNAPCLHLWCCDVCLGWMFLRIIPPSTMFARTSTLLFVPVAETTLVWHNPHICHTAFVLSSWCTVHFDKWFSVIKNFFELRRYNITEFVRHICWWVVPDSSMYCCVIKLIIKTWLMMSFCSLYMHCRCQLAVAEWSRELLLESWIQDPVACCNKCGVTSPKIGFTSIRCSTVQLSNSTAAPASSATVQFPALYSYFCLCSQNLSTRIFSYVFMPVWVVVFWHGYLSGARCRLAYGPADATRLMKPILGDVTPHLLQHATGSWIHEQKDQ